MRSSMSSSTMTQLQSQNSGVEIEFPKYNGLEACTWKAGMDKSQCPHFSLPRRYRPGVAGSALDLIGDTPMVKLDRIVKLYNLPCELWAKCEFFNSGGSVKDRIGLRMVEEAEKEGRIKPGDTLIEPTSGNTGVGLCMAAAIKGYKMVITLPEKMSGEKVNMMKCLGAEILRTPTEAAWNSPESHIGLALRLNKQIPNSHILDQYKNPANPLAHYEWTVQEMLEQTDRNMDVCIVGAGTGGTITGIARGIKDNLPSCKIVGLDPIGSILAVPDSLNDEGRLQAYQVEGIGYDFIPTVLDRNVVDEWVKVGDKESFQCARDMLRHEALMCGGSSGTALAGAVKWIRQQAPSSLQGKRVVIVLPDSSRNYMSKFLDDDWMLEHSFLQPADIPQMKQWWSSKTVKELPLNPPITVPPQLPCKDLIQLLRSKNITQVPVVDEQGGVLGIVSEGNLVSKITDGRVGANAPVKEVMYKKFLSVSQSATLGYLSKLLDIQPHVLVVSGDHDKENELVSPSSSEPVIGILTRIDLLSFISEHAP